MISPINLFKIDGYAFENPEASEHQKPLVSFLKEIRESSSRGYNAVDSEVSPHIKANLYESNFSLFRRKNESLEQLKRFIGHSMLEVAKHRNSSVNEKNLQLMFKESWFHITRHGGYHGPHRHPNCAWGGLYYVDIGEATKENGSNTFYNPQEALCTDVASQSHTATSIEPRNGHLFIFPSYLLHDAKVYSGEKERIVISFNALLLENEQPLKGRGAIHKEGV